MKELIALTFVRKIGFDDVRRFLAWKDYYS
jgi:hypothetical protein